MSDRQSRVVDASDYVQRQREHFTGALNGRAEREGIETRNRTTWLRDLLLKQGEDVRWQTVQRWFLGTSYPGLRRVRIIAMVLGMNERDLILPLEDQEDDPDHWRAWVRTPDGAAMSDAERQILRFFPWTKTPAPADYRALLTVVRNNAER